LQERSSSTMMYQDLNTDLGRINITVMYVEVCIDNGGSYSMSLGNSNRIYSNRGIVLTLCV